MIKKIKKIFHEDTFYKDLFITFGGQILVMILSFVLNKIISNQYSISDFGVYNLAKRFASVITFVMLMAMGIAIPKYVAEAKAKKNKSLMESYMRNGLKIIILMFVLLTVILLIKKELWAKFIFGTVELHNLIIILSFYSLGNCLITYAYSFYRGIDDFIKYTIINLILQIIFIVSAIFVRDNLNKLYMLWSICAVIYGMCEIFIIYRKNNFSLRTCNGDSQSFNDLFVYSLPRVPGEFILFAYTLVPLTIISNKFGNLQVGYFSAALSINSLITPLFSLVGTILLPLVSGSRFNNNEDEVNKKIKVLGYIYIGVSVLVIAFVYLLGKPLLTLLFNSEYTKSFDIVKIMIISIIPNAYYLLLRNPLDGKSKFPYNTICLTISFIIYIILLLLSSSVKMCAYATIVAYTILGVLSLICWNKIK